MLFIGIDLLIFAIFLVLIIFKGLRVSVLFIFWFSFLYPFINRILIWINRGEPSAFVSLHFLYNLLIVLCFVFYVLEVCLKNRKLFSEKWDLLVWLYVVWGSLMVFHPGERNLLSGIWGFKDNILPVSWFFLVKAIIKSQRDIEGLGKGLAVYSFISGVYTFYQATFGLTLPWDNYWFNTYGLKFAQNWFQGEKLRAFGFMSSFQENCIVLGNVLVFLIAISSWIGTKYLSMALFGYIIGNFQSISRTSIAMLLIALFTYLLVLRIKSFKLPIYASIPAIAYIAILVLSPYLESFTDRVDLRRLGELRNPLEAETVVSRRYLNWAPALKLFIDNPFGIGAGNLSQAYANRVGIMWIGPHNNFLQIALGYSIIGVFIFITIMSLKFFNLYRELFVTAGLTKRLTAFKIGLLTSWLIGAIFNQTFTGHMAKYFWFMLGIPLR